jgi:VanZ family protein
VKRYFLPPLIVMVVIFLLSNQPVLPGATVLWADVALKKVAHFSVYVALFLSWWWSFCQIEKKSGKKLTYKVWLIPLLCLLFAASDEWHQSFIPGRTSRGYDVFVDTLGYMTAWLWAYRYI